MEKFSRPFAENFARKMEYHAGREHPTVEDYEEAFRTIGLSQEELHKLISKLSSDPEVQGEIEKTHSDAEAIEKIIPIIRLRLDELPLKLRESILNSPNLLDIVAGQILFSVDEKFEEKQLIDYVKDVERNFDREFTVKEIVEEICKAEGVQPSDLSLEAIEKDRNDQVVALSFELVSDEASQNLNEDVAYILYYPFKNIDLGTESKLKYPVIVKAVWRSAEVEELKKGEAGGELDLTSLRVPTPEDEVKFEKERLERIEQHGLNPGEPEQTVILDFENGFWQKVEGGDVVYEDEEDDNEDDVI